MLRVFSQLLNCQGACVDLVEAQRCLVRRVSN